MPNRATRSRTSSFRAPAISAASRCAARCRRPSARWSGPSSFSIRWDRHSSFPGKGIDVRPHPHIGLATVTYLFDGEMMHRDSLGSALSIRPGEVNLMTAGRGIVHSERTAPDLRASGQNMFGIQSWMALAEIARGERAELRASRRRRSAAFRRRRQARASDHRLALWRDVSGCLSARLLLRRGGARAGRRAAARSRLRRARHLSRLGPHRHRRSDVRRRPASRVQARRSHLDS